MLWTTQRYKPLTYSTGTIEGYELFYELWFALGSSSMQDQRPLYETLQDLEHDRHRRSHQRRAERTRRLSGGVPADHAAPLDVPQRHPLPPGITPAGSMTDSADMLTLCKRLGLRTPHRLEPHGTWTACRPTNPSPYVNGSPPRRNR